MNKSIAKFLKIAIPLALGIFLIFYSYNKFSEEQLKEIGRYFSKADYWIVTLSVLLTVISHVIRALRWNILLEPVSHQPKVINNFMAISIAYLMNIFIPKSGEVSRAIVLDKYEKVPFATGFGTIISERVIDLIFLLCFTAAALMLQFDVLFAYLSEIVEPSKLILAFTALIVLLLLFFLFLKFSNSKLKIKLKEFFLGLKDGVLSILKIKKIGLFIVQSFLIWGLYLGSFYTATLALEETSTIDFATIIITFVVGSFAFAFTNSGFGSYPFFVAGILAVFGIAETVGTAFGWIVWTSSIASIVLFGVLSFIFLPIYNRSQV
ncbi:lysylphosphatidylglycerol synthase transmembrane domain-containing protein [Cochleicola gelatinilyticus]|uniref:TIGR00374 family protein n=1 Tax=Cochleicola gelatinilyticus TaxID=1763537 RepID=A0A167IV17_9FLAO|nr:lysylphosphatidylglycerol synthase transmembrane domain-containing protein [Cochleicola gelatinilyticus]OAB80044.1 hypothetical protein ULVI_04705 [Cochleicola gelatinilyticus]